MESRVVRGDVERQIAGHVASASRSDIPDAAIQQAKRAILWWTATALEGSVEPEQQPLRAFAVRQGGRSEATLLGTSHRLPADAAGMINGRAGKAWEHEDKFWVEEGIGVAIGCCVVPAAVAMAQACGNVSGQELVTAVALAVDLEARLAAQLEPSFFYGRVATNATFAFGNYGAAIAASKISKLCASEITNALGLVHGQAAGYLQGQLEGRGVSIQAGFAVRNGIVAARLAGSGVDGSQAWLTGKAGLYAALFSGSTVDADRILVGLGHDYRGTDLAYKAYPCGIVAHPALDAVRSLGSALAGQSVEHIEIVGPPSMRIMAEPIQVKRSPDSAVEAQFSIPWAVACVLRDGTLTIEHYSDQSLGDAGLRRTAEKVSIKLGDPTDGSSVAIKLADGAIVKSEPVLIARGHPSNPLPTAEIMSLFMRSAERVCVSPDAAERSMTLLGGLDEVSDVDEIYSGLVGTLLE